MNACTWLYRLLYANLLWLLFTAAGLVLFGIFPATAAMFSLTKQWLEGAGDDHMFREFMLKFKAYFIQANILGAIVLFTGILLYVDFQFFLQAESTIFVVFRYTLLTIAFVYIIMLPYLFPLLVEKKQTIREVLKSMLFMSITRIAHSAIMVIGTITIFAVFSRFAGFFLLFLGSTIALWLTWNVNTAYRNILRKQA
ncbi:MULTISPECIES: DUF624 domain-containing protein [unclassified Niallia]|uniref:YesL family protein n=1 Tax=unclassified Niallia TaxID=2837522 RepID=UPI001EDB8C10|nr:MULTISPECIES: DUF624 domain-containing protein [unclassified Niallia]MDL0434524.1 DUF624 domain-containing protein [Niallia sp. SS-2023]UPO88505.1 DUF624 domain-containing protein [Niallia sp. Man26]